MSVTISAERPDSVAARALIEELETELAALYPTESRHGYSVDKLIAAGVSFYLVRSNGTPVGCGGIQLFGNDYGELKRMYVRPESRGSGYAELLLKHLTEFAAGRGIRLIRLETGIYQTSAIRLYERFGFYEIEKFGNYKDDPLSRFYEMQIR